MSLRRIGPIQKSRLVIALLPPPPSPAQRPGHGRQGHDASGELSFYLEGNTARKGKSRSALEAAGQFSPLRPPGGGDGAGVVHPLAGWQLKTGAEGGDGPGFSLGEAIAHSRWPAAPPARSGRWPSGGQGILLPAGYSCGWVLCRCHDIPV